MSVKTDTAAAAPAASAIDAAAIAAISERLDEPGWLRDLRAAWWQRAESTPWPSGQEEEWRRTSLEGLPWDAPLVTDAPPVRCALDDDLAAAGVVFSDLRDAVRTHPELVERHLGRRETLPVHARSWAQAHAAWTAGTFLYVPRGVTVDRTLVAEARLPRAGAWFPLTLVVAEEGSDVSLLEEVTSPDGDSAWYGGVVDLVAAPGARVRYAGLQRLGDRAWNIGAKRVEVGQDAEVTTLDAQVGSSVTKVGLDVRMTGKGGTSRLLGILAAGATQHIDIDSVQDLIGSHTTSDLLYLSALYDEARAAFYGVTRVEKEAKGTSSYQECRNLLLSPKAGAEPIPVLEIETNDILRCGHGATAGAIDPTQRFYAQSRGLSEDEAERMIVRGFFEQVVSQIRSETIRERVLAALAPRIGSEDAEAAA
ncbi:MAG TPA: Fe-S cluster assembly protein SufD [Candidatus Limnocylindria bacterium]|jgi:Fe-S cluster assembly protein SufD